MSIPQFFIETVLVALCHPAALPAETAPVETPLSTIHAINEVATATVVSRPQFLTLPAHHAQLNVNTVGDSLSFDVLATEDAQGIDLIIGVDVGASSGRWEWASVVVSGETMLVQAGTAEGHCGTKPGTMVMYVTAWDIKTDADLQRISDNKLAALRIWAERTSGMSRRKRRQMAKRQLAQRPETAFLIQ